jgi:competence protein ComFC
MNITMAVGHIINVISPSECGACKDGVSLYPLPVCQGCVSEILSSVFPNDITSPVAGQIRSCLEYTPAVKCCVKSFKFHGNKRMAELFKKVIGSRILSSGLRHENYDVILPVPLHNSRKRKRGYNQAEVLSEIVSTFLGKPLLPKVLIKTKNTPPQSGLNKRERSENLKGSFAVTESSLIRGKSVLLVDDVMTTGATIEECSKTLLKHGSEKVYAFTLARVV